MENLYMMRSEGPDPRPCLRRTSRVWRYFQISEDKFYYMCRLCTHVGLYSNTTNMRKHIQNHHPGHYQDILDHTTTSRRQNMPVPKNVVQGFTSQWGPISVSSAYQNHSATVIVEDRKHDVSGSSINGGPTNSTATDIQDSSCDNMSVALSPDQVLGDDLERSASPSARPESYKLSHNNHLSLVLEALAGDESFMDVTLTAEGKSIKAHKSVLSAVSPYFKSVLRSNPCQHPIIIMPRDISFNQLRYIIMYIYRGEMTVAAEDLSCLLKTAETLQITGLSPADNTKQAGEQRFSTPGTKPDVAVASESSSSKRKIESTISGRKKLDSDKMPQKKRRKTDTPTEVLVDGDIKQEQDEEEELDAAPVKQEFGSDDEDDNALDYLQIDTNEPTSENDSLLKDPDPLSCPHCPEYFESPNVVKLHFTEKHPDLPYNHCACDRFFKESEDFERHKESCLEHVPN